MSDLTPLTPEQKSEFEKISAALKGITEGGLVNPSDFKAKYVINNNFENNIPDLYDGDSTPMNLLRSIENKTGENTEELRSINEKRSEEIQLYKKLTLYQKKQLDLINDLLSVNDEQVVVTKEIEEYLVSKHGKDYLKDKTGDAVVNIIVSAFTAILRSKGCLF